MTGYTQSYHWEKRLCQKVLRLEHEKDLFWWSINYYRYNPFWEMIKYLQISKVSSCEGIILSTWSILIFMLMSLKNIGPSCQSFIIRFSLPKVQRGFPSAQSVWAEWEKRCHFWFRKWIHFIWPSAITDWLLYSLLPFLITKSAWVRIISFQNE